MTDPGSPLPHPLADIGFDRSRAAEVTSAGRDPAGVERVVRMDRGWATLLGTGGLRRVRLRECPTIVVGDWLARDPDGTLVEFVQSLPDGMEAKAAGKFLSAGRISTQIYHAGFVVGNSQRSLDFYGRLLGFQETWRAGSNPNELSWINMRVPDGVDYVEFMLYRAPLDPKTLGGKNHLSLAVPDITKAVAELKSRPAYAAYGKPLEIHTGVNRKRQVNLYDSDGTRVELMEPFMIDGAATAARARLSNDQRHGEAVVALAADGLQRGRGEPRVGCEHRQEAAHTLDALVGAVRVDDLAVADDVVAKDHGAGP